MEKPHSQEADTPQFTCFWYKGTNTDGAALAYSFWHFDLYGDLYGDQIQPLSLGGGGGGGSRSEGPYGSTSDIAYGYGFTYFFSRDAAFSAVVLPTELRHLIVP